jgi:16S rRNA (guanine966-N2)-methyltransferase
MTRIVAGIWKGRTLRTPPGSTTRPTAEKIRAALGNALQAAGALEGAAVLDLYAGSGALGLELVSRGAKDLVAVEQDRRALEALRGNVSDLGAGNVEIVASDVAGALRRLAGRTFDLVVADPPYDLPDAELRAVLAGLAPLLAAGADVSVERSVRDGEPDWQDPIVADRSKRYGDTMLCYGRAQ